MFSGEAHSSASCDSPHPSEAAFLSHQNAVNIQQKITRNTKHVNNAVEPKFRPANFFFGFYYKADMQNSVLQMTRSFFGKYSPGSTLRKRTSFFSPGESCISSHQTPFSSMLRLNVQKATTPQWPTSAFVNSDNYWYNTENSFDSAMKLNTSERNRDYGKETVLDSKVFESRCLVRWTTEFLCFSTHGWKEHCTCRKTGDLSDR